jgi:hypothetical protein
MVCKQSSRVAEPGLSVAWGRIQSMSTNQNANPSLVLLLGGAEHTIPATLLPPIQSRHVTGLGIARYQLEFTVHGRETSDELTAEISRARVATSPISESGTDRKFVVENHSYSYSGDDRSDVSHSMSLRELEFPRAEAVECLGYRLQPEEYREDAEDGSPLVLGMVVTIAEGDVAGFEDALHAARSEESPYFPVIRVGVSETPISMRFGQCVWEEREGARRHMLYLVSEENDELKRRGLGNINEPRLSRIQDQTEKVTTRLEGLLEVLVSTGTLDAETVARILAMEPSSQSYRFAERTKNVEVDWMD